MKIENQGIVISGVPDVDSIRTTADGEVVIKFNSIEHSVHLTARVLGEIIEALTVARDHLAGSNPTKAAPEFPSRRFRDDGEDIWHQVGNGDHWAISPARGPSESYPPLKEIRDAWGPIVWLDEDGKELQDRSPGA